MMLTHYQLFCRVQHVDTATQAPPHRQPTYRQTLSITITQNKYIKYYHRLFQPTKSSPPSLSPPPLFPIPFLSDLILHFLLLLYFDPSSSVRRRERALHDRSRSLELPNSKQHSYVASKQPGTIQLATKKINMEGLANQLKRGISRQFSTGSLRRSFSRQFSRQSSLDPRRNNLRFSFGRQSSLDPIRRSPLHGHDELSVPENLDATMHLLFLACRGDVKGVEDLLNEGIDVNSIDLDGRTALHIAACEGHVEVVKLLLSRRANIDARDRWGSTACADAKYYGNVEVYNILKARGAKAPKTTRKTPMTVANPREIPEYELNPLELQVRKSDGITKGMFQVAKWNGTKVAVKILEKDRSADPESINAFKHELTLLEKVRHPNVIQFVGAVTQNLPMMIVAEYHSKGDLASYLLKKGRLSPSKVLRFGLDIARGINYLHECKPDPIIHCDLKPKNILLDNGGLLKVAGFGLIRLSNISPDKAKLAPGTLIDHSNVYMAPEIYNDEIFDRSVDAYSFGVILYEMLEGLQPFHPKTPEEAVKLMCLEKKRPPFKIKVRSYPQDLKELIDECWHSEPVVRPTFSEIITRLDKVCCNCSKQGWWKDTFKLPWK